MLYEWFNVLSSPSFRDVARTQLLSLLGRPTRAPGWSLPRFVHIQAVAQLLKSSSPVKSIDLGDTCISDDGAQAWYGSMGRARRISDSVGRKWGDSISSYRALHGDMKRLSFEQTLFKQVDFLPKVYLFLNTAKKNCSRDLQRYLYLAPCHAILYLLCVLILK